MKTIDDDQKNLNALNNNMSISNKALVTNALAPLRHESTLADQSISSSILNNNKRKFSPGSSTVSVKKSTSHDSTNAVIQKFVNDRSAAYDFVSTEDFESFVTTIDWTEQTPIAYAPMHTHFPLLETAPIDTVSIDTNILDDDALAILLGLDSEDTELEFNSLESMAEKDEGGNASAQYNGNNLNHAVIDADVNTYQNKGSDNVHEDANKNTPQNKYRLKIYTGYFYLKASTSDLSSMHPDYADIKEDVLNACKAMHEKAKKIKEIARVTYRLDESWRGSDSITRLRFCLLQAASNPYEFMYIVDRILSTQHTEYVKEVLNLPMNSDEKNPVTFFEHFMRVARNSEDAEYFSQAIKRILTSRIGHFTNKLIENPENSHLYHFINLQTKNQVSLVNAFAMLNNKEAIYNSKRYENHLIWLKQEFYSHAETELNTKFPQIKTTSIDLNDSDHDALAILLASDSEESELEFNGLEAMTWLDELKDNTNFPDEINKKTAKNKNISKIKNGYFYLKASPSYFNSMHSEYAEIKAAVLNACKAMHNKSNEVRASVKIDYRLDELVSNPNSITRLRFCLLQASSNFYEFMYIVDRILKTQYVKFMIETLDQHMDLKDKNSLTFFEHFVQCARNSKDTEDFSQAIKRILLSASNHFVNKLIENNAGSHLYHFIKLQDQASLVNAFAILNDNVAIRKNMRYKNYLIWLKQEFHYTDDNENASKQATSSRTMDLTSNISSAPVIALEQQLASQAPLYPTKVNAPLSIERKNAFDFLNPLAYKKPY